MKLGMKKLLIASLATAIMVTAVPAAFADGKGKGNGKDKKDKKHEQKHKFNDVDDKWNWANVQITKLAENDIIKGYADGTFQPNKAVTRLEAIVMAVRLLGLKAEAESAAEMNSELNFKDAEEIEKKYAWAVGYIAVALENDLFAETESKLQPEKPADRLWITQLLVKAMNLEAEAKAAMNSKLTFKDAKDIPAGSVGYVAVAVEKGLVKGYDNGSFQPNKPVTRAEMAVFLDRAGMQLPEYNNGFITGTVQAAVANNKLSVTMNGKTQLLALSDKVYIFKNNKLAAASELAVGDSIKFLVVNNVVVFVEVTGTNGQPQQPQQPQQPNVIAGTLSGLNADTQGKWITISVNTVVNGATQTSSYVLDANVQFLGNPALLTANQSVELQLANNLVKAVKITAPTTSFAVTGTVSSIVYANDGAVTQVVLNQTVSNQTVKAVYDVDQNIEFKGNVVLFAAGQTVDINGVDRKATRIAIQAPVSTYTLTGKLVSAQLGSTGKLTTIKLQQTVNNRNYTTGFDVDANVVLSGDLTKIYSQPTVEILAHNQNVITLTIK